MKDKQLWKKADFSTRKLNVLELITRLRYIKPDTKYLKLKGNCTERTIEMRPIPNTQSLKELMQRIHDRSPILEQLTFEAICYDWTREFDMSKFRSTIYELNFLSCVMPRSHTRPLPAYSRISDALPNLTILRFEYCNFIEPADFEHFAKLPNLVTLSLRGCTKIKESQEQLTNACRDGFKALRDFDLRETYINDAELQLLIVLEDLTSLALQYPPEEEEREEDSDEDEDFLRMLGRTGAEKVQKGGPQKIPRDQVENPLVTDRGIAIFGAPPVQPDPNEPGPAFPVVVPWKPWKIERLTLRDYETITDETLTHLETNAPKLVYLDVCDCPKITEEGVKRFRNTRGNCELKTDYPDEQPMDTSD